MEVIDLLAHPGMPARLADMARSRRQIGARPSQAALLHCTRAHREPPCVDLVPVRRALLRFLDTTAAVGLRALTA